MIYEAICGKQINMCPKRNSLILIVHSILVIKSERKVLFGQMRYHWIDLTEVHSYKLIKPTIVALLES